MPSSPGYVRGPLVIPNTFMLKLKWGLSNGNHASNVLHWTIQDASEPDAGTADELFTNLTGDARFTTWMTLIPTSAEFIGIDIKDLREANQPIISSTGAAVPGTNVNHAAPESVALAVTLRTALAGRAHRGRVYLTGFTVNDIDAVGHATDALVTAAQNFVQAVSDTVNASEAFWFLGVAHRGHAAYLSPATGLEVPAEVAGTDPVTSIVVLDKVFDSQRRRK